MPTHDYQRAMEAKKKAKKKPSALRTLANTLLACALLSLAAALYLSQSAPASPVYKEGCLDKFSSTLIQPEQINSCLVKEPLY